MGVLRFLNLTFKSLLVSLVLSSPLGAVVIRDDYGGNLRDYEIQLNLYILKNERVQIAGVCASACTLYVFNGCVRPSARLLFHAPIDEYGVIRQEGLEVFKKYYPKDLWTWFMQNAAHLSGNQYAELSGAQAIALGARGC